MRVGNLSFIAFVDAGGGLQKGESVSTIRTPKGQTDFKEQLGVTFDVLTDGNDEAYALEVDNPFLVSIHQEGSTEEAPTLPMHLVRTENNAFRALAPITTQVKGYGRHFVDLYYHGDYVGSAQIVVLEA